MPNYFEQIPAESGNVSDRKNCLRIVSGKRKKALFWLFIAIIFLGLAFLLSVALAYKFYSTSQKVIEANPPSSFFGSIKQLASGNKKILRGQAEGRVNILLLGLAGENYPGENLTDSIIIASVDPNTYQTALLSIPRDLYVQIPEIAGYTKINALYARGKDRKGRGLDGIEDLKESLAEITGLNIHYYVALDFDGFKKTIGELGGIKIQVPKDLHDERYPGPNFSYETFDIKKGLQVMNGETALKYARTRHDEDGDFGRAYRQQQILESARQKAFSLGTLVNIPAINNILNILGDHLRTDIPIDELESFIDLSKKIDTHTTINKVLDAGRSNSLLAVSHVMLGNIRAFILIPRTGNYEEIHSLAEDIFNLDLIERKKRAVAAENASVAVINGSGTAGFEDKVANLLKKMGYQPSARKDSRLSLDRSLVYDLSNNSKPFSLEEVSKELSAKVDTSQGIPSECQGYDLCIIVGSNLLDNLNYEEGTVQDLEQGYDQQQINEKEYINLLKKGSNKKYN